MFFSLKGDKMANFFKDNLEKVSNGSLARYYTGAILVSLVVLIIVLNMKFLLWAVLGVCYLLAFAESCKLFALQERTHLYATAILIWIVAYFYKGSPLYIAILALAILASYNAFNNHTKSKDYAVLIYPTIPFLCLFGVYADFGAMAIVWLIAIVALSDSCAYFGGKAFGKSPLSPISPKKTIEGALIGLIVASMVGTLIGITIKLNGVSVGFISSFFISVCVAFISIFGDLFESMLKRVANVKDSGNILPGHGGVLDRVDGILFGGIAFVFLLEWVK